MAKLRIVDEAKAETFYQDLLRGLDGRSCVTFGNNTKLVSLWGGGIALRLHHTDVVLITPDNEVIFRTGGYWTTTTMNRIHAVASKFGYRAGIKNGIPYLSGPGIDGRMFLDFSPAVTCVVGD